MCSVSAELALGKEGKEASKDTHTQIRSAQRRRSSSSYAPKPKPKARPGPAANAHTTHTHTQERGDFAPLARARAMEGN